MAGSSATIKVSAELRDRINHDANARGLTAAGFLEELLDRFEREEMLAAFARAFATADDLYRDETRAWAATETPWPPQ